MLIIFWYVKFIFNVKYPTVNQNMNITLTDIIYAWKSVLLLKFKIKYIFRIGYENG